MSRAAGVLNKMGVNLEEKMDDSRKPKMLLRQALKHEFDKVMDNKKITNQIMDDVRDEIGGSSKYVDQLDGLMKVIKDKKIIALAKEQKAKIEKLLKAKTVGDVRAVSPDFVSDFEESLSEAADVDSIIKELIDTGWSGDNESQGKAVQLMRGLAFSDDPKADAFMKKLDQATSNMKMEESLNEAKSPKMFAGLSDGFNWIVQIDGVDNSFPKMPFGRRLDDERKAIQFSKDAKKAYAGAKGKATMAAAKATVKDLKSQGATQFYAKWKPDSSMHKDDSVEIFYK